MVVYYLDHSDSIKLPWSIMSLRSPYLNNLYFEIQLSVQHDFLSKTW